MTYPFEAHMAPARFASYASWSPNKEAQRALYLWNIELAQALNTTLGHVEVFLRHAIDTQLRTWNSQQPYLDPMPEVHPRDPRYRYGGASEEWLKHPAKELATLIITGRGRKTSPYDTAYQRAVADQSNRIATHPRYGHTVNYDDILAHTTLGLWGRLLPDARYRTDPSNPRYLSRDKQRIRDAQIKLWNESIKNAFPHQNAYPYLISHRVNQVSTARNRIAHQESLLNVDVKKVFRSAVRLTQAIDPALGSWVAGTSRVMQVYAKKPYG